MHLMRSREFAKAEACKLRAPSSFPPAALSALVYNRFTVLAVELWVVVLSGR
jgi:hypothetical protein